MKSPKFPNQPSAKNCIIIRPRNYGFGSPLDPEELIGCLHDDQITEGGSQGVRKKMATSYLTPYGSKYANQMELPKYHLPSDGSPSDTVCQILRDELDLVANPKLNLASFVGTYLEPNATQLMAENMSKNLADNDEDPAIMDILNVALAQGKDGRSRTFVRSQRSGRTREVCPVFRYGSVHSAGICQERLLLEFSFRTGEFG
ncbi:hypothetical protein BJ170DRAFT_306032 [Xylariales sp. AK1849]|nr:hypothetical protein BJ170DRAFT_306032 [Xylariales sp. AK1849]